MSDSGTFGVTAAWDGRSFNGWLTTVKKLDPTAITSQQRIPLAAEWRGWLKVNGAVEATATDPPADTATTAGVREEPARRDAITRLVGRYVAERPDALDRLETIGRSALANQWDAQRTELELLRSSHAAGPLPPNNHITGPIIYRQSDPMTTHTADAITASLMISHGVPDTTVGRLFSDRVMSAATSRDYRGMTLHGMVKDVLRGAGRHAPSGRLGESDIRDALFLSRELRAGGGGPSTSNISGILSGVVNKTLLSNVTAVPTVWQTFCRVGNLPDFKEATPYRLTGKGTFEKVAKAVNSSTGRSPKPNQRTSWTPPAS